MTAVCRWCGGFVARQARAGAGGEPSGMSYLLTALALTVGVALIAGAVALIHRGDQRNAVRLLAGLAAGGLMWAGLLGMAQIRYHHDRYFCGGASGGQVDQSCIARRGSVRGGPDQPFRSYFPGDW